MSVLFLLSITFFALAVGWLFATRWTGTANWIWQSTNFARKIIGIIAVALTVYIGLTAGGVYTLLAALAVMIGGIGLFFMMQDHRSRRPPLRVRVLSWIPFVGR